MSTNTSGETMIRLGRTISTLHRAPLVALVTLALAACGGGGQQGATATPPPALEAISIGNGHLYTVAGIPEQLTVTAVYSDGTTAALESGIAWASSEESVASVHPTGLLIPWAAGAARITATHAASGLSATAELTSRVVVSVTAGATLPAAGAVDTTTAYFHVKGLSPGTMFTTTVGHMSDDVDVAVYSDISMTPETKLCEGTFIGVDDERCVAPANASGELWVAVDGQWTRAGARFDLDVPRTEPVALTGTLPTDAEHVNYLWSVGATNQFFEVTGLRPGAPYAIRISDLTADLDLAVYADRYRYATLCESYLVDTVDDSCNVTATSSGTLVVEVDGQTTPSGGSYTLTLVPR